MASLADELDPAFDDLSLANGRDGRSNFDRDDEVDESYDYGYGRSVSSTSSTPIRPSKRSNQRRRTRGASDASSQDAPIGHHADGFSLADELGGGSVVAGSSLEAIHQGVALSDGFDHAPALDSELLIGTDRSAGASFDDEARARRDQEHYLVSSEALNESTRQTESFLRTLHKAMSNTSASSVTQSRASTSQLVSSASTNSINAGQDDTAGIEQAAAGIVRQLREHAQLREGQVRDLQECDRIIRRAFEEGGEYLMALAETNDVEEVQERNCTQADDRDPLGLAYVANGVGGDKTSNDVLDNTAGSDVTFDVLSSQTDRSRQSDAAPEQRDGAGSTMQGLLRLQQSTTDLVYSLGSIHEHNQIAHATLSEATRKLRNVRAVLSNWRDEVRVQEQSSAWIAAHELGLKAKSDRPTDIRQWMRDEMDQFEFALEEAHTKARQLLIPVRDPVLDRLAASASTAKA